MGVYSLPASYQPGANTKALTGNKRIQLMKIKLGHLFRCDYPDLQFFWNWKTFNKDRNKGKLNGLVTIGVFVLCAGFRTWAKGLIIHREQYTSQRESWRTREDQLAQMKVKDKLKKSIYTFTLFCLWGGWATLTGPMLLKRSGCQKRKAKKEGRFIKTTITVQLPQCQYPGIRASGKK